MGHCCWALNKTLVLSNLGIFSGETTHRFLDGMTGHLDIAQIPKLECLCNRLISDETFIAAPMSSNCTVFIVSMPICSFNNQIIIDTVTIGRVGIYNVKDGTWNVIFCKDKFNKIWELHLLEFNDHK
ncbi:hypothetical protein ACJRO7_020497 [Eucalyptus globulus]|uniref:Uncharacterized protein n=1 Tax=Eucalyptus globulus TaxID=34317 RepID=A0ABD3KPN8_EUCGL